MPLNPLTTSAVLLPSLLSAGNVGISVPKLSLAIGTGLTLWVAQSTVSVVASGTAGVGVVATPLFVPQPLILLALSSGFVSAKVLGVSAPLLVTGLANGLSLSFPQGVISGPSTIVGSGLGFGQLKAPPAMPFIMQGFEASSLKGPANLLIARALSLALDQIALVHKQPVSLLGSVTPTPASDLFSVKVILR